jgi:energy-converting hydrogenase Eha subunit E
MHSSIKVLLIWLAFNAIVGLLTFLYALYIEKYEK